MIVITFSMGMLPYGVTTTGSPGYFFRFFFRFHINIVAICNSLSRLLIREFFSLA